jgi:hypothetical protein
MKSKTSVLCKAVSIAKRHLSWYPLDRMRPMQSGGYAMTPSEKLLLQKLHL